MWSGMISIESSYDGRWFLPSNPVAFRRVPQLYRGWTEPKKSSRMYFTSNSPRIPWVLIKPSNQNARLTFRRSGAPLFFGPRAFFLPFFSGTFLQCCPRSQRDMKSLVWNWSTQSWVLFLVSQDNLGNKYTLGIVIPATFLCGKPNHKPRHP